MAINRSQVTLDEAAVIDKRLLTVTRVDGPDTVHSETFVIIDPDDGSLVSMARVKNAVPADDDYGLVVRQAGLGKVDTTNSTTTTLGASGNFTGTFVNVTHVASIVVSIFADQASATDGVKFQWSSNGTNVDIEESSELNASAGRGYNLSPRAEFFRVNYTNGATPQGAFRLETILRSSDIGHLSRAIDKVIDDTFFCQLTRSVLAAKRNDGTYANIRSTNGNNLKIAVSEYDGVSTADAGRVFIKNPTGTNMGDGTTPVRVDPTGGTTQPAAGAVADDGAGATVNPLVTGLIARITERAAVNADNDVVRALGDSLGKTVFLPYAIPAQFVDGLATLTGTGDVAVIGAGAAGVRNYITSLSASNTSATAVRVDFKDGATTKLSFFVAASGGGAAQSFPIPVRGTAATAWNAALSAAVTDVRVSSQGYRATN